MKRLLWLLLLHLFGIVTTLVFAIPGGLTLEGLKRDKMPGDSAVWICAGVSLIGFCGVLQYARWYKRLTSSEPEEISQLD